MYDNFKQSAGYYWRKQRNQKLMSTPYLTQSFLIRAGRWHFNKEPGRDFHVLESDQTNFYLALKVFRLNKNTVCYILRLLFKISNMPDLSFFEDVVTCTPSHWTYHLKIRCSEHTNALLSSTFKEQLYLFII